MCTWILHFSTKILYALLFILMHATCSVSFTLHDFINLINVGITNHEEPHYVVFFIFLLLPHWAKYSQHRNILSLCLFCVNSQLSYP